MFRIDLYNLLQVIVVTLPIIILLHFSDCNGVSLPVIGEVNNTKKELCPRCTCTYESRNTTTMKVMSWSNIC